MKVARSRGHGVPAATSRLSPVSERLTLKARLEEFVLKSDAACALHVLGSEEAPAFGAVSVALLKAAQKLIPGERRLPEKRGPGTANEAPPSLTRRRRFAVTAFF
ncbi:unnamed protein product [Lampetra planeri]